MRRLNFRNNSDFELCRIVKGVCNKRRKFDISKKEMLKTLGKMEREKVTGLDRILSRFLQREEDYG